MPGTDVSDDSVEKLASLARRAAQMRWGPEDSGSAPVIPGETGSSRDADDPVRMSGDEEAEVLKALDPFWTRGIIKPPESDT